MIGILCAMDQEVAALYEMIQQPEITEISGYRFAAGRLAGKDVVVAKCGVGKVNAAICAQTMLLTYHPELVMNSGVAGSLSEKLRICDVAVGQDIVQHDIDTTACGDELALVPELDRVYLPCDGETARVDLPGRGKGGRSRAACPHCFRGLVCLFPREKALDCGAFRGDGLRNGKRRHCPGLLPVGGEMRGDSRHFGQHRRRARHGI